MANIFDKNGREIMVGDVLKVYHFTAVLRRKKHYMYKQVMIADKFRDGTKILRVGHLDLTDDFYTLICDGKHLPDYEIVQSIKCDHHERPCTTSPAPHVTVTVDAIMEQAQVFASTYSLVGGRFDDGTKYQQSEDEKAELRRMIEAVIQPPAPRAEGDE